VVLGFVSASHIYGSVLLGAGGSQPTPPLLGVIYLPYFPLALDSLSLASALAIAFAAWQPGPGSAKLAFEGPRLLAVPLAFALVALGVLMCGGQTSGCTSTSGCGGTRRSAGRPRGGGAPKRRFRRCRLRLRVRRDLSWPLTERCLLVGGCCAASSRTTRAPRLVTSPRASRRSPPAASWRRSWRACACRAAIGSATARGSAWGRRRSR
jgi:hypothetical protein